MGETAFILYAAVYLALGMAAMLISMFIRKKKLSGGKDIKNPGEEQGAGKP